MKRLRRMLLSGLALALLFGAMSAHAAGTWGALGSGLEGNWVDMFHTWDGKLAAAGRFTTADGQPAHNMAVWDGAQWGPLGDGWDTVSGIATHNGQLAVAGRRPDSTDSEIALWDGGQWTRLVESPPNTGGLASYKGDLYQREGHEMFGGATICNLMKYNGASWTSVRSWTAQYLNDAAWIDVLRVIGGELYLHVRPYSYVYAFDGTDFTPYSQAGLTSGLALVRASGEFYAVGRLWPDTTPVTRWNGVQWETVFDACWGIDTAGAFNDKLIVAGEMKSCAAMPGSSVLSWDGSNWSAIGGPMNDCVWALAVYQGRLIAGGPFTEADGVPISLIAEYIGTPTPVTIGKFRAHASPGGVDLAWQITADEPFDGFSIYRSDDGGAERPLNAITLSSDTRTYTDHTAAPGGRYSYVLVATGGESGEISSQRVDITVPLLGATLHQNIPNPFNPETTVRFTVATQGRVTIAVYTSDGRRVRSLVDASYAPGEWSTTWDGTDDKGQRVASGVYYYRMRSGKIDTAKKMVLLK